VILEDIISTFIIQIDFPSLAKNTSREEIQFRQTSLQNLMFMLLTVLNFNQEVETRMSAYAYLLQILENNNNSFSLSESFTTEVGIGHVSKIF
jgi:hypothetical protein